MIAHSISMDGVGFTYLSPTCYWYIVEGEDRVLLFVEEGGVGADVIRRAKRAPHWGVKSRFCVIERAK